jgi:hypothetical protein
MLQHVEKSASFESKVPEPGVVYAEPTRAQSTQSAQVLVYTRVAAKLSSNLFSAHTPLDLIARAISFASYNIPDNEIFISKESMLPGNWKNLRHSSECKDSGTELLAKHLIIRVPSVVLPSEFNYILIRCTQILRRPFQ